MRHICLKFNELPGSDPEVEVSKIEGDPKNRHLLQSLNDQVSAKLPHARNTHSIDAAQSSGDRGRVGQLVQP